MENCVKIINELTVVIYDCQTFQELAVIECLTKCAADNIYATFQQEFANGDIASVHDN